MVNCIAGLGIIVFSPLTHFLNTYYGWRGSMLILSGITLNIIPMGCVVILPGVLVPHVEKEVTMEDEEENIKNRHGAN